MELQFDKEIDAILRKAGVGVDARPKGEHLDADVIAAFAENALPEKVKAVYTAHFADCGRCRKLLANSIAWPPTEKATSVVAPIAETSIPWYSKLLRAPSIALAMGGLVIAFAGVLGYLALQNRSLDSNATVAQVNETPQGGPYVSENGLSNAMSANTSVNTETREPNTVTSNSTIAGTATGTVERGPGGAETDADKEAGDVPAASETQPVTTSPPPPPAVKAAPKTGDRRDEEKPKDDDEASRSRNSNMQYDGTSREAKKISGPYRAAGPRQNQTNTNDNLSNNMLGGVRAESAKVKNAGGKKFESRDGAWYDTAYRGQTTKNVRRGTEEYQKLDSGLRSIASTVGGVVVVVWKGTAYRIQ